MNRTREQQVAAAANRAAVLFEHEGWTWLDPGTGSREYPVTAAHLALMMVKQLNSLADDDEFVSTGRLVFLREDWSDSIRILVEVGSVGTQPQAADPELCVHQWHTFKELNGEHVKCLFCGVRKAKP